MLKNALALLLKPRTPPSVLLVIERSSSRELPPTQTASFRWRSRRETRGGKRQFSRPASGRRLHRSAQPQNTFIWLWQRHIQRPKTLIHRKSQVRLTLFPRFASDSVAGRFFYLQEYGGFFLNFFSWPLYQTLKTTVPCQEISSQFSSVRWASSANQILSYV